MPKLSLVRSLTPRPGAVFKARLSADRAYMAVAVEGGEILVYDATQLPDLRLVQSMRPSASSATVRDVAFSRDSSLLVAGCYDGSIYIYRLADAEEVAGSAAGWMGELDRIVAAQRAGTLAGAVGPAISSADADAPAPMYVPASVIEKGHSKEVKSVAVNRFGRIASCSRDRVVSVWGSSPDAPLEYDCLAYMDGHTQDIKHVAFGPAGDMLLSASYDNRVQVYRRSLHQDPDGIEPIEEWGLHCVIGSPVRPEAYSTNWQDVRAATGSCHTVWSAEFSPDGTAILAVDGNGCARLYRVAETGCRHVYTSSGGHGRRACYDLSILDLSCRPAAGDLGGPGPLVAGGRGTHSPFLAFTCGADNSLEVSVVSLSPGAEEPVYSMLGAERPFEPVHRVIRAPHAHMGEINTVTSAWAPVGSVGAGAGDSGDHPVAFVITGGDDGRINVWRLEFGAD